MIVAATVPDVCLRPLRAEDSDLVRSWRNSPAVAAGMVTNHTIVADEHGSWLAAVLRSEDCRYWVISADGRPTGLVCIYEIERQRGSCRWGFYNAEVRLRRRGIITSALAAVLDHAFGDLGIGTVNADVLARNTASVAIDTRLGFQVEQCSVER